jgi:hypothetical protein
MKAVDENNRRPGQVDEQAGKRESPGESIGIKLRMDQDLAEAFENGSRQQGNCQGPAGGLRAAASRSRP